MHNIALILSAGNTPPTGYDRLPVLLFPLLGVLATIGMLLFARTRVAANAVFRRPFAQRTVIARSNGHFFLYDEDDPGDPDGNSGGGGGPKNPEGPGTDPAPAAGGLKRTVPAPWPVPPTPPTQRAKPPPVRGTGKRTRGR